jgi:integrase
MQAKLSATTIKALRGADKPYEVVDTALKGFLLRVQPTGRKTFYYSYRNKAGNRKRIKLGVLGPSLTIHQARDQAVILAGDVAKGIDVQGEKAKQRRDAVAENQRTLSAFMENHYLPWALSNLKSGQQSVDRVKCNYPDLLPQPMSEITIKKIERWRIAKLQAGLKPTTINRAVNSLRAVLTKATEWDVISQHPLSGLKSLTVDNAPKARYLSTEEETALYEALAARDGELKAGRARGNNYRQARGYPLLPDLENLTYADRMAPLVILSLKTGMRRGELFDLEWSSVNLDNRVVTVNAESAKSRRTRHIPLSATAFTAINAWRDQYPDAIGLVFPADDGGRLDNVRKSWATILDKAGISHFRWHDMRHDFASKLVMAGVPLNTVRELCGHSNLNTTLRYAHLASDHKTDAVALLG